MKECNSKVVVDMAVPFYPVVLILAGSDKPENPLELTGRAMDEEAFPTEVKETEVYLESLSSLCGRYWQVCFLAIIPKKRWHCIKGSDQSILLSKYKYRLDSGNPISMAPWRRWRCSNSLESHGTGGMLVALHCRSRHSRRKAPATVFI